ncbi:ABC transporter ATP-binding protein [Ruminococcus sp.]|uniref:ABC transporter ATP-binding protein n=1 Tax=Ruminococcus sp. TaxID=41978 RepID=UPI0025EC1331|nr:ABC transporter ATP-binding protein [Ruminococcus sp.]
MSKNNENKEERLSAKEKREIIKRTLKAIRIADSGYFIREIIECLLFRSLDFAFIYLSALVIDGITQSKPIGTLLSYAAIVVGVQAVIFMIDLFLLRRSSSQTFARSTNLHKDLWQKVMTMDFIHLESTDTQNKFSNADSQVDNNNAGIPALCNYIKFGIGGIFLIITGVILIIPMVLAKPVTTTGVSGFVQSIWGFLVVVIITVLLEMLKSLVINPKAILGFEKVQNDKKVILANRADGFFSNYILRNYRNGKEIRIYSQQKLIDKELDKARDEIAEGWLKAYKSAMLPNFLCQLVNIITKALMYGFAVMRAASGMLSPGEVIAFALYFEKISAGVSELSDFYGLLKITPSFCKKYFDFLDIPDEKYKGTIPTEKRDDNEYEFEFKHVWFKYPNCEEYVLKDVNLKWRIGEKMALVGRNGSGKSTLIKLLCRLYDATKGEITLNGIDIRKYSYEEYVELFSVVFQDSKLFSFSLAENVAADTEFDSQRVENCVRKAGLSERLDSMPDGINTYLYKDFNENGVEISGGEAQKLCLARAIYKGSPFIVLDEPTAALDPISEYDIYTKFNSIVGTRTAIYISHRLSSCRFCDDITVLDNGSIAERGSHDQLIDKSGIYAAMWAAQAEYYKDTAGELFA